MPHRIFAVIRNGVFIFVVIDHIGYCDQYSMLLSLTYAWAAENIMCTCKTDFRIQRNFLRLTLVQRVEHGISLDIIAW